MKVFSNVFVFVFLYVNVIVFFVRSCLLITLIKYLKGHKPLGLIFEVVSFLAIVCVVVIVSLIARSCLLVTLNKYLRGHNCSLRVVVCQKV